MARESDVFQRKPFRSGDSKVITVTGMPVISSDGEVNIKPIHLDGKECLLISSYQEMSMFEMEQLPENISTGDNGSEVIATHGSVYDAVSELSKRDLDIPEGKELVLSLRDKTQ